MKWYCINLLLNKDIGILLLYYWFLLLFYDDTLKIVIGFIVSLVFLFNFNSLIIYNNLIIDIVNILKLFVVLRKSENNLN